MCNFSAFYRIKFCPFLMPTVRPSSSNYIIDKSFLIMYILCPFTKNWNIGLIREESAGWVLASAAVAGSRWRRLVGARLWTRDQGRRRVAPKTTSWSPPQLLPDQRSKDPRPCSLLGSSEIKLIKTTDNAALETTSCFLLFWLALICYCKINDQQRRDVK